MHLVRARGLKSLVVDAIEHGSRAVERIQLETARTPFAVLEAIPRLAIPVKGIHEIHDLSVAGVHGMIRLVNRVVGQTLDLALDVAEANRAKPGTDAGSGTRGENEAGNG